MYKNFNPKPPTSQSLSLKLQTNEKMLYSENSTRKRFREMVGTEMFKIKLTGEWTYKYILDEIKESYKRHKTSFNRKDTLHLR